MSEQNSGDDESDDWESAVDLYNAKMSADRVGAGAADDADSDEENADDAGGEPEIDLDGGVGSQHRIVQYVPDEERQTSDFLTLYERTQLEIITANRIADTGVVMTDCSGLDEALTMARREIAMRKSPYMLLRCIAEWKDPETAITYRRVERWRVNDIS